RGNGAGGKICRGVPPAGGGLHFPGKATILDTDTFDKYALLGYRKRARGTARNGEAPGAFWQGLALCLPGPMPAVPGSASRLPCLAGRAFTPAGEVGGGGRVRGGRNRPPCHVTYTGQ